MTPRRRAANPRVAVLPTPPQAPINHNPTRRSLMGSFTCRPSSRHASREKRSNRRATIRWDRRFHVKAAWAGSSDDLTEASSPVAAAAFRGGEQEIASTDQFFIIVLLPAVAVKEDSAFARHNRRTR